MKYLLRALRDAQAFTSGEVPEWVLVFPAGEVLIEDDAPCLMDEAAAKELLAHQQGRSSDMVIDYEHQTLTGERAPAAGWITALEWRADGLWARAKWTEAAAAHIAAKEYRYHSPVFAVRKSDRRIVKLYNVALTNQPRMRNVAALTALAAKFIIPETPEEPGGESMLKKLLKLLGLAETASEDEALAVVQTAVAAKQELAALKSVTTTIKPGEIAQPVACKEVLAALELGQDATAEQAVSAIAGIKAPARAAGELGVTVAKLQTELAALKSEGMVKQALAEGKTSPAELDAWARELAATHPEQFEKIVLKRPVGSVVPVQPAGALAPDKARQTEEDEVQLSVNKQLGISSETWKQYGPKKED